MNDIVLLSTADWTSPGAAVNWTNKQHVAVELARRGHRVLYVESLGLRAPGGHGRDLKRVLQRLGKAFRGAREVAPNLWALSPLVIPLQRWAAVRRLNRRLLAFQLSVQMNRLDLQRDLFWTYNPLTTEFLDLDGWPTVYHCVDDIGAQPGMPEGLIERAEERLCRVAHTIFATAPKLADRCRRFNPRVYFLPNVADFSHFNQALDPALEVPADLAGIAHPRIGFHGALSEYKIDFQLLRELASNRPDLQIVLIGEVGLGEPNTDITGLRGLSNLHLLGSRPYEDLPRYLKGFDIGLLPNRMNQYNESCFPMKFFEYLSAGLPVVSVPLPALADYLPVINTALGWKGIAARIDQVLGGAGASLEERLQVAREHTYEIRTDRMMRILEEGSARR